MDHVDTRVSGGVGLVEVLSFDFNPFFVKRTKTPFLG